MNHFKGEIMDRSGIGLPNKKIKIYWAIMNGDNYLSCNGQYEWPDEESATNAASKFIEENSVPHELSIRKFVRPFHG